MKLDVWQLYKHTFGWTIVRPKDYSAEHSFGRKNVRPKTSWRKKIIRPTKFLHANRGPGYGSVRFDVYVFGRAIVRPKNICFGRKIYVVRPKVGFPKFWRPDCHESVTHLRDSTPHKVWLGSQRLYIPPDFCTSLSMLIEVARSP
jgi:hypothetical protein